jgi:hypothetical protein
MSILVAASNRIDGDYNMNPADRYFAFLGHCSNFEQVRRLQNDALTSLMLPPTMLGGLFLQPQPSGGPAPTR